MNSLQAYQLAALSALPVHTSSLRISCNSSDSAKCRDEAVFIWILSLSLRHRICIWVLNLEVVETLCSFVSKKSAALFLFRKSCHDEPNLYLWLRDLS